ncbi:polysaccharide deacetylase family protein [Coraliomargarita parva]|uniref:polysaccharide deacetylase family protein n=1 Tax=Coraliomargarita parva TaxID=3014050 RepID=UPI0022B3BFB9|nr:polysaccharide deacetylase family protein [Coraliomargarita parva]
MTGALGWKLSKALAYPLGLSPLMGSVASVAVNGPKVALTFDDGPHPDSTPFLLDLLKKHGVVASFFVVGESARKYPEILERAVAEGHALCNHGWSHRSLPMLKAAGQAEEIRKCAEAIGALGHPYFRPPYGHQSVGSRLRAGWLGQTVVTWSEHVADWRKQPVEELAESLRSAIKPGAIVLLHDAILVAEGLQPPAELQVDRRPLFEALDTVLGELGAQFDFLTIPELLSQGKVRWSNWFRFSEDVS